MRIQMPQVGESVTEAVIERWLKREGDRVEKYEPLAEIVTDKVSMELPSPVDGVFTQALVAEGGTVAMGADIAEIATDESQPTEEPQPEHAPSQEAAPMDGAKAFDRIGVLDMSATNVGPTGSGGPITSGFETNDPGTRARYSPAVLRLAELHDVDLSRIRGSGLSGRVTRKDVQARIDARPGPPDSPPPDSPPGGDDEEERVPLTPVRRMIAQNMTRSASEIPEAWSSMEVDVSSLVAARARARDEFERRVEARLTPLAFALKAVAEALRANPIVNSTWADDAIILKRRINLGVAMATPRGLIVPVIRDADRLNVGGLAQSVHALAAKARRNALDVDEVQGGTFTVNNTGALGSVVGKGIINHPQAAILNLEAIVKRPVVVNDAIAIRSMMNLCLTFDHRIMDGAEAGAFLNDVKGRLEAVDPAAGV